ncbi:hypothetical protein BH09PSE6_BH09PSE6_18110 [soil metagenome]
MNESNHLADGAADDEDIREPGLWVVGEWTARVIKNEDDDGWAVAMTLKGQSEPALVGPWTMGRDKRNPKPLDTSAFSTLVKTASEVIRRREQQLHAILHKEVEIDAGGRRITVMLDITPDDDDPRARLSAHDAAGELLASADVRADFALTRASASKWADAGFAKPR